MLKYFSVSNFMNFKEELVMDFSNIRDYKFNEICIKNNLIKNAIIYGKNSVGKTNLMQAFLDIYYTNNTISIYPFEASNYKNADANDDELISFNYKFLFDDQNVDYCYQKIDPYNVVSEKLIVDGKLIFEYDRLKSKYNFKNTDSVGAKSLNWNAFIDSSISTNPEDVNSLTALMYIFRNTPSSAVSIIGTLMSFILGMRGASSVIALKYVQRYPLASKIAENEIEIRKFEDFLNDFGVKCKLTALEDGEGRKDLYFDHKKPLSFFRNMSSGTKQLTYFYFAYLFWDRKPSFLILDEFDANYHFELSEKIVEMLENMFECQVVLTSHNTSLLSNTIMRPDCYFILDNGKLTPICDATTRELRQGHNLEKLFRNGEFNEF